jgi:hypothetical protein
MKNAVIVVCVAMLCTATAAADDKEIEAKSATFSKTFEMKVEQHSTECEATAVLEYFQRGGEAEVEATIENPDCAASSGEFIIETTVRADGQMDSNKLSFPETWSRDDEDPVVITKRYPIGDNVDLMRVKVRKLRCECSKEAAKSDADAQ